MRYDFSWKFRGLHVRNFQNKIPCLLCTSYVHIFNSLGLNKWCSSKVSEGYFVAKYKTFPGDITYCVRFANFSAVFTSMHTHVCIINSIHIRTYKQVFPSDDRNSWPVFVSEVFGRAKICSGKFRKVIGKISLSESLL